MDLGVVLEKGAPGEEFVDILKTSWGQKLLQSRKQVPV